VQVSDAETPPLVTIQCHAALDVRIARMEISGLLFTPLYASWHRAADRICPPPAPLALGLMTWTSTDFLLSTTKPFFPVPSLLLPTCDLDGGIADRAELAER
jgi:hypothetical protein